MSAIGRQRLDSARLWIGAAGAALLTLVLFPLACLVVRVRGSDWDVVSASLGRLLGGSVALAAAITALAMAIGVPLGAFFARARIPGRSVWLALHAAALFLPPEFNALGWFHWLGENGLLGSVRTSTFLFGPAGYVLVMALALAPAATIITWLGIAGLDASLEDAGLLAAKPAVVLRKLLLPAAAPAIALAAAVVFGLALSDGATAMFLRVRFYTSAIYTRIGGMELDTGEGALLTAPMVALGLIVAWPARRPLAALRLRPPPPARMDLGRAPLWCAITAAVLGAMPIAVLFTSALHAGRDAFARIASGLVDSLIVAFGTGIACAGLTFVIGAAAARARPFARFTERVLVTIFFVPAAVIGLGGMYAWNRPATSFVYTSVAIVPLALVARVAALGAATTRVAVSSTSPSYEDAAVVAGASPLRALWRVVRPMHSPALVVGVAISMVFALRDIETAVMLAPPGFAPLGAAVLTLETNGSPSLVALFASTHTLLCGAILFGAFALARRVR